MLTRRRFITAGIAGGALLGVAWWLRRRGPVVGDPRFATLAALDAEAPVVIAAIAAVLLDGALPADAAGRAAAIDETVAGVAQAIAGLPPASQQELGELFTLLGLRARPHRAGPRDARVVRRDAGGSRRVPRALARQPLDAAALGLRCAAPARVRRVVRQPDELAGDRLRRSARAVRMSESRAALAVRPLPRPAMPRRGGSSMRRSSAQDLALEADVAIVGTGAGGGTAAEILAQAGLSVVLLEEGRAQVVDRLPHARVRGLSRAVPGIGRAQDAGQGDQHPAGPLRRRRNDGQLDQLVPDAGGHAQALGARNSASRASASPTWRRGSSGWSGGSRSRRGTSRPTPTTRRSRAAPRRSGIASGLIRRNVRGLLRTWATAAWAARSTPSSRCW